MFTFPSCPADQLSLSRNWKLALEWDLSSWLIFSHHLKLESVFPGPYLFSFWFCFTLLLDMSSSYSFSFLRKPFRKNIWEGRLSQSLLGWKCLYSIACYGLIGVCVQGFRFDRFSFGLCSIALLSLSAQRCLSFHPSLVLFCQLSGSSLVYGVLEFQEGESRWDPFHSLCGAWSENQSPASALELILYYVSLIISFLHILQFCLSGNLLIKCCLSG